MVRQYFVMCFRKMYPDAGRKEWQKNGCRANIRQKYNLVNIVPDSYDIDTVRVIAFLQNSYTKEIYQAASLRPTQCKSYINRKDQVCRGRVLNIPKPGEQKPDPPV